MELPVVIEPGEDGYYVIELPYVARLRESG